MNLTNLTFHAAISLLGQTCSMPRAPLCLPPAPLNGGPLDVAPPKVGRYAYEPKIDGRRIIVHAPSGAVWNQYGQPSVAMRDHEKFISACDALATCGFVWLDCELMEYRHDMMRGAFVVLDLVVPNVCYSLRRVALERAFPLLPSAGELTSEDFGRVYLIPAADDGLALSRRLQAENKALGRKFYEGVVAKRTISMYPTHNHSPKTKTADWIKHRFDQ